MSIKIEFPAGDKLAARVLGEALTRYAVESEVNDLASGLPDEQNNEGDLVDNSSTQWADDDVPADAPSVFSEPKAVATDTRADHNGVAFDDAYCANASDPFYGSGKRAGQWKKRRGVDDSTYDRWYADQLGASPTTPAEQDVDTAAAFSAPQTTDTAAQADPEAAGKFMAWVSEKQASGELNLEQINAAYAACGVGVADLFPPNSVETIAASVAKLRAHLGG